MSEMIIMVTSLIELGILVGWYIREMKILSSHMKTIRRRQRIRKTLYQRADWLKSGKYEQYIDNDEELLRVLRVELV